MLVQEQCLVGFSNLFRIAGKRAIENEEFSTGAELRILDPWSCRRNIPRSPISKLFNVPESGAVVHVPRRASSLLSMVVTLSCSREFSRMRESTGEVLAFRAAKIRRRHAQL